MFSGSSEEPTANSQLLILPLGATPISYALVLFEQHLSEFARLLMAYLTVKQLSWTTAMSTQQRRAAGC